MIAKLAQGVWRKGCRGLRIKDVWFDGGRLWVRGGKGQKDRMTFLPKEVVPESQRQIAWATQRHLQHLEQGNDNVYLPCISPERLRLLASSLRQSLVPEVLSGLLQR
jgi:integrase